MAATKNKPKPAADEAPPADARRKAVRIRAGVLHAALKDVAAIAAGGSSAIPILSHVLIEAGNGTLAATAGNLDLWARRDCATDDVAVEHGGGDEWVKGIRPFTMTLPAKPLLALLTEFEAEQAIVLEAPAGDGSEGGRQAKIAAGGASFRLNSLPAEDFPLPPAFSGAHALEMRCSELADAFHAVEHAISTEETRYYLNGVYIHAQREPGAGDDRLSLRCAATDGHRLARLRIDPPEGAATLPPMIVMRQTIALLDKLLASAVKAAGDRNEPPRVLLEVADDAPGALTQWWMPAGDGGEVIVTAKSVDGTFPDYARVIPAHPEHGAVLPRVALADAIRRVGVIADAKSRMVRAAFSANRLTLSVTTPELGSAREELACSYDGPEVSMGLNGQYWREALAALASDEIALRFDGSGELTVTTQVLLIAVGAGEDDAVDRQRLVQVLMPMRGG